MDSGSEITAKIRSAIKAKLVELGAYVDDELPDYIMVMIANKKTKDQMTVDLNLFLGKNSQIFTDWVHGVLDRLQAISQKTACSSASSKSSKKPTESQKAEASTSNTEKPRKEKSVSEKKSKHDVKENKSKLSESSSKRSSTMHSSKKSVQHVFVEERTISENMDIVKHDDDILDVHPELHGDLDYEISGKTRELSTHETHAVPPRRKRIEAPSYSHSQRTERVRYERAKRRSPSSERRERSPTARKRRSVVGQVLKHKPVDDEEYDPTRPQLGSVVKVSERKFNVPVTMQPKPSIFLKALNEANASVTRRRRKSSSSQKLIESPDDEKERNFRETVGYRDVEMNDVETEYTPKNVKPKSAVALRDSRRVEYNDETPPKRNKLETEEELVVDTSPDNVSSTKTRFVVTLDGVSSNFVRKIEQNEDDKADQATLASVEVSRGDDDQDTLIVDVDDEQLDDANSSQANEVKIKLDDDEDAEHERIGADEINGDRDMDESGKILEKCKFWPSCKMMDMCPFVHPSIPCKIFPNCRFGDRCLYIHPNCRYDTFCTNNHCPFAHSIKRKVGVVIQPIPVPIVAKAILPMCKFGARCMNPNCSFKHPKPCLYGLSCNRPDCPFTHPEAPATSTSAPKDKKKFRWVAPVAVANGGN